MAEISLLLNSNASAATVAEASLRLWALADGVTIVTTAPDALPLTLRQLGDHGCRRLIVAGGDGTVSRVVNALLPDGPPLELAILPLGTGNDLARSLDVPLDRLDAAWHVALHGASVPMDVIRIHAADEPARSRRSHGAEGTVSAAASVRFIVNAATGGFGGEVTGSITREDKQWWGAYAYWLAAMKRIVAPHSYRVVLTSDDGEWEEPLYGLAIANGRFVGGGFPIAPAAYLDDGLLEVTLIPVLPTLELLAAGIDVALGATEVGTHRLMLRTRRLRVHADPPFPFSVDGEPLQEVDTTFDVVPRAVLVVAGNAPALVPPP